MNTPDPDQLAALLLGLIRLGDNEDSQGRFRVTLAYDNYQDGAQVLNGNEEVLGACYDMNPDSDGTDPPADAEWQFLKAIEAAINKPDAQ